MRTFLLRHEIRYYHATHALRWENCMWCVMLQSLAYSPMHSCLNQQPPRYSHTAMNTHSLRGHTRIHKYIHLHKHPNLPFPLRSESDGSTADDADSHPKPAEAAAADQPTEEKSQPEAAKEPDAKTATTEHHEQKSEPKQAKQRRGSGSDKSEKSKGQIQVRIFPDWGLDATCLCIVQNSTHCHFTDYSLEHNPCFGIFGIGMCEFAYGQRHRL